MKKFLIFVSGLVLLFVAGCSSEFVRVDINSFNENPEEYENKRVILTADIKTLTENQADYIDSLIEFKPLTFITASPHVMLRWKWRKEDGKRNGLC